MSIRITKVPLCRHTLTNGRRCKSAALTTSAFCFHHRKLHGTRPQTIDAPARSVSPALAPISPLFLTDRNAIQHALGLVFTGITTGELDLRVADKMIATLSRASRDLSRPPLPVDVPPAQPIQ